MKLIFSPASPFVRKVRVMIYECGLTQSVELVPVKTTALATDPLALNANPLGKIPALVVNESTTLFDSRVICRYLDDRANAGLYPQATLWEVLTLEALADGILEAAVAMVYEARLRPEEQQSQAWVDAQWGKITKSLDALDAQRFPMLEGAVNFAQLSIACALGYLDFRHDGRKWRDGRAWLTDWNDAMQDRPSLSTTLPSD